MTHVESRVDANDLLLEADRSALLRHHSEVLELIATGAPLPELLAAITSALEELIDGCRCSVLLLSKDGATLRHGAAPSLPAAYSTAIDGIPVGERAGSCGTAAHTGQRVIARDVASDWRWTAYRDLALAHGLRSCWSTPIIGSTGRPVGTFAVYHGVPHTPDAREERLVDRFTDLASVAVAHASLFGALAESEERFRRAFDDNAVGMALIDPAGRFTRVNGALASIAGRDAADLLGQPFTTILAASSVAPWTTAFTALRGGVLESTAQQLEVAAPVPGPTAAVAVTASAVAGPAGQPMYLSLNVLDITQRLAAQEERRARREAEVARRTAEDHNRAKSEFLTTFSHELRSPLQAITGFTELLGALPLDDARRAEALTHIDDAVGHVLSLVDDLLDVARLEARVLPLALAPVLVSDVVAEAVQLLQPLSVRRDVGVRPGEGLDAMVVADARRLRQILLNLVGNAIRYSTAGCEVSVTGSSVDGDSLSIRVHDDGPGIPAAMLDRLFVPFDRLAATDTGYGEGVGLGLRVARGLCEAMGGRLAIESVDGVGTTAVATLPRHRRVTS